MYPISPITLYMILSVGSIHRNPHLAHMFYYQLLVTPIVWSDSLALTISIDQLVSSLSMLYIGHCIQLAQKLAYHVQIIILVFALVQLCFILALLFTTCSVPLKY